MDVGAVAELADVATLVLDDEDEDDDEALLHDKSNSGAELKSLPIRPNDGAGVVGAASCIVYHHVFVLPNREQPTSSQ